MEAIKNFFVGLWRMMVWAGKMVLIIGLCVVVGVCSAYYMTFTREIHNIAIEIRSLIFGQHIYSSSTNIDSVKYVLNSFTVSWLIFEEIIFRLLAYYICRGDWRKIVYSNLLIFGPAHIVQYLIKYGFSLPILAYGFIMMPLRHGVAGIGLAGVFHLAMYLYKESKFNWIYALVASSGAHLLSNSHFITS
jgi:hypothetical protein